MSFPYRVPAPVALDQAQLKSELEAATGLSVLSGRRDGPDLVIFFDQAAWMWTDVGDVIRQTVGDHVPPELAELDAIVEKARAVWRGEDTFTQAQAQKILAGLVLIVARHLR